MSTSSVMNLPEGYTLEEPTTPQPQAVNGGVSGLPPGYTLEQPDTGAPSSIASNAFEKAREAAPFTEPGAYEREMGKQFGDNKAQAKQALKSTLLATGETAAGVAGASALGPTIASAPTVIDKARDVVAWADKHAGKAAILNTIADQLGIHPFDLLHKVAKYGADLFDDDEPTPHRKSR